MEDYYLGNGNKRPKLADYNKEFGWNGHLYYTIDKLKYDKKVRERKELKETNKKASKYAENLSWGILPAVESKKQRRNNGRIYKK